MLVSKFFSEIAGGNIQLNFNVTADGKMEIFQIAAYRNKDNRAVMAAYKAAPLEDRLKEFVFSKSL